MAKFALVAGLTLVAGLCTMVAIAGLGVLVEGSRNPATTVVLTVAFAASAAMASVGAVQVGSES